MANKKKSERLYLRATEQDKQKIAYNASLMNVTMNEYILLCVRRKRIIMCENFPDLIYELSRIGNNINQIAALSNTNNYLSEKNLDEVKNLMSQCHKMMYQFIDFITEPEKDLVKNDTEKISELLEDFSNSLISINLRLNKIEEKM